LGNCTAKYGGQNTQAIDFQQYSIVGMKLHSMKLPTLFPLHGLLWSYIKITKSLLARTAFVCGVPKGTFVQAHRQAQRRMDWLALNAAFSDHVLYKYP